MPRVCFVPGCRTHKAYYERGVAMFSYPRGNPELLLAWNRACSRESTFKPPRYACICEKHFDPAEIQGKTVGRATLQQGAVPSRFLDGWRPQQLHTSPVDSSDSLQNSDSSSMETVDKIAASNKLKYCPVEKVFLKSNSDSTMISEVVSLAPSMFCRMCGFKLEQENTFNLRDFPDEKCMPSLLSLCLIHDEIYQTMEKICLQCYQEVNSFVEFIKNCHVGQRRMLEQYFEATTPEMHDSGELPNIQLPAEDECDGELSDTERNETYQMDDESLDSYIDSLIVKLKTEKRTSTLPRDWECLDCRKMFQHRNHLAVHRRTCPLVGSEKSKRYGPFTCQLCDKVSKTLPGHRYHLLKMHDRDKIQATGCGKDNQTMVHESDENYPNELRALKSRKTVVCPICTDTFRTSGELRYHLPSHKSTHREKSRTMEQPAADGVKDTVPKRYMCSVCGKMERSNAGLELHMKFHLKQKDWACEQCDKQYYTKADLRQHVLTVHEKLTYTCGECEMVLNSRATYTRHRRLHDESQLKKCNFCTKKFTTTNALKRHVEKRHLGQTRPRLHSVVMPVEELIWEEIGEVEGLIVEEIEQMEGEQQASEGDKDEQLVLADEDIFGSDL
ncbi:zinc finger and BTB domain-containing protein 17-like [Topomyia yanbarensis]|uniref:zinc finger and BTB domain-containing protein 17-like n=1 Tax=Topomyia yanbarensis TaxID=2498891 RepID=UPI00273B4953|nr:zinc finger and BTB domain-containing protein 17-like [Topomyia yanbarensis]XP_058812699.1 zinc finger and BTB domain-containing protein 17-like [Topomyia yanbarensis]